MNIVSHGWEACNGVSYLHVTLWDPIHAYIVTLATQRNIEKELFGGRFIMFLCTLQSELQYTFSYLPVKRKHVVRNVGFMFHDYHRNVRGFMTAEQISSYTCNPFFPRKQMFFRWKRSTNIFLNFFLISNVSVQLQNRESSSSSLSTSKMHFSNLVAYMYACGIERREKFPNP